MIFQFVPSGHFLSILGAWTSRRWSWTQVDLETGADIALPPTDKWRQNERHAFDRPGFHFLIITYFKNCNQASVERWCKCFPGVLQKYPIDQKRGEFSKDGTVRQLCSIVFDNCVRLCLTTVFTRFWRFWRAAGLRHAADFRRSGRNPGSHLRLDSALWTAGRLGRLFFNASHDCPSSVGHNSRLLTGCH